MGFSFDFNSKWGSIAASILCAIVFGTSLRYWLDQRSSRVWPRVDGKVIDTRIQGSDSEGYTVQYLCAYRVGSEDFTIEDQLDETFPTELIARGHARDRLGDAVEVAFDPQDPTAATLDPGALGNATLFVATGAGFFGLAVYYFLKWWGDYSP